MIPAICIALTVVRITTARQVEPADDDLLDPSPEDLGRRGVEFVDGLRRNR